VSTRLGVLGRRAYALLAVCSAVLHGISLGHVTNLAAMALMVAMLAGCLYCARDLWLHGTQRGWVLVALMNFAMIAIHLPASSAHHHGAGLAAAAPMPESTVMTLATALAAVEVTVAAAVLYYRTRALRPLVSSPSADVRTPTLAACPDRTIPIGCLPTTRGFSISNRRRSPAIR
jgi:hypothetical protein